MLPLLLCGLALSKSDGSTCGPDSPSKVPGCDHADHGSCGNACCIVEFEVHATADVTHNVIKTWLDLAPSYAYVNSSDAAGHNPSDIPDSSPFDYIMQGTHITTSGFVDKIDMWLRHGTGFGREYTSIRAFSSSGIHGALGDNGQNYKNIDYLLENALGDYGTVFRKITYGCGQ